MGSKGRRQLIRRCSVKAAPKYPFAIDRIELPTLAFAALHGRR